MGGFLGEGVVGTGVGAKDGRFAGVGSVGAGVGVGVGVGVAAGVEPLQV